MKQSKKVMSAMTLALAFGLTAPALSPASAAGVPVKSVKFNGMPAPSTIEKMSIPYSEASAEVTYEDNTTKTFPLHWKQLFNTGEELANIKGKLIPASTPLDVNGNPILFDGEGSYPSDYFISNAPDANSFLKPINGKLFMVSHYESHSVADGSVPDSMTLTELKQNVDGTLDVVNVKPIDFSSVYGLWVPCNGSLTPWNTHLGSEEYEPDAHAFEVDKESNSFKGVTNFARLYFGDKTKANPYYYGWSPEVTVSGDGSTNVVKHYSMGRFSKELGQVLPDNKTVLFGDDGEDVAVFMYVADKAGDLSGGTLYSAKYTQTSNKTGGAGSLQWINLGHSTDDEIEKLITSGTKFSDIFETSVKAAEGFVEVRVDGGKQFIKLIKGQEKAAAFLESRRYAQYLGATAEFNKMEGIAVSANKNKAYLTIADIGKGMSDGEGDINVPKEKAGAIYELPLKAGQKDSKGNVIPSSHVPTALDGMIMGQTLAEPDTYGNKHDVNKISAPDNINYSDGMDQLFIGEDSSGHINNFVWAYDPDTKALERIVSVPAGAEATGLQVVDDRNGYSYTMSNFQHPGDGVADAAITAVNKVELAKLIEEGQYGIDKNAAVGYVHGLSLADKDPSKGTPKVTFNDIKNHYAKDAIIAVTEAGLFSGVNEHAFAPNKSFTRSHAAIVLNRLADSAKATGKVSFKDVKSSENAIAWATENNLIAPVSSSKFAPYKTITREQFAVAVYKYLVQSGVKFEDGSTTPYQDDSKISKEAKQAIYAMQSAGLMTGSNNNFNPQKNLTRAQAATVFAHLLK